MARRQCRTAETVGDGGRVTVYRDKTIRKDARERQEEQKETNRMYGDDIYGALWIKNGAEKKSFKIKE